MPSAETLAMSSMEASINTGPRPRRRSQSGPSQVRAIAILVVAIIAGALMMYAAYVSQSGLRATAWEKEQTATSVSAPAAPQESAPAGVQPPATGYAVGP
jgi:hypothetical protein